MTEVSVNIFDEIEAGYWDEGLEALGEAIRARREYVRARKGAHNKMEFVPGTKVRLINIKPKYLLGITGEVSTRIPSRAGDLMVDIDPSCYWKLGRYSRQLGIPASSLEKVEEAS